MPDILGSTMTSKFSLELAAMLGAFLSLAHRGLKPIASLIAFVGGSAVALIFGQPVATFLSVSPDWIIPFGFFIGSTGWSIFGGVLRLFERFREDPVGTVKDVKELTK
jgi:hypothetical protein